MLLTLMATQIGDYMDLELFLRATQQTQTQFAAKLGISRVWLNLVMSGKRIPSRKLQNTIAIETKGAVMPNDLKKICATKGK